MMSSVQERLQIKREPLDKWSIREQLCLASAVARSGDQNWMSVSRALKPFGDSNRPPDWFHQKNCAAQYGSLLENVETPKRKKRTSTAESTVETPGESILRKLTQERLAELDKLLLEEKLEYKKLQDDMVLLQSGNVTEEQLDQWCAEIDEEEKQREDETQAYNRWLREREKRKQEIERAWRPKIISPIGQKRKASESIDSLMECDQYNEDHQVVVHQPPIDSNKPALSPLLTSLLKSPSHTQNNATSILHSAITNHNNTRNTSTANNPTIASLLNSSACVSVSPGIQHLVSSAISQTPPNVTQNSQILPVDMLGDTEDTLPNLKVEDIESLSANEPLPEIKNEEVEVIISDLIQNADIVENPEQHLQLVDNDDIITNLENELQELCEKEELAEAARAAERAKNSALAALSGNEVFQEVVESPAHEDSTSINSTVSKSCEIPVSTDVVQETVEVPSPPMEIIETKVEIESPQMPETEAVETEIEVSVEKDKEIDEIDPFEFREEIEVAETLKPPSFSKLQELRQNESKDEEKKDKTVQSEPKIIEEEKEIVSLSSTEEKLDGKKDKLDSCAGSVEIVEVIEIDDDSNAKELNKKQIEDIVHFHKTPTSPGMKPELIPDENKQNESEIKLEHSEVNEDENDLEVELQTEKQKSNIETDQKPSTPIVLEESKREETFTPDFSSSYLDDLEVNKLDKSGKAKRDYSRTKKKEDKDFDILLAVEKAVSAHLEESDQTEDENSFFENEKKSEIKFKIKQENERSNSPWLEEEFHSIRSKLRSSATATPVDSVPGSPASSLAMYEDDRDYRNWKKSVMLVYSRLETHKNASIFWKPITDDQAPGYHSVVYRPMDLQTIRKNIENGVIRTTSEFYRDVLLMFTNAIMFNKTNGTIYNMAKEMQEESLQPIKILMQAQLGFIAPKRETRTSESSNKRKRTTEDYSRSKKRRED